MTLQTQIAEDLKTAMKARDKMTTGTLRMAIAALKNRAIEEGLGPQGALDDQVVQKVLATEVKRRRDAAGQYTDAGRPELAATEEAEIVVLQRYLPEQLGDDELAALVDEAIAEAGATGPADMGKVMKPAMARVAGRAEGGRVSGMVKARLSELA